MRRYRTGYTRAYAVLLVIVLLISVVLPILPEPARADERAVARSAAPSEPPVEESGPGWQVISAEPVAPKEALRILYSQQPEREVTALSQAATLATSEAEITPEIEALARALENDPKLIFDYVHNHIEYVPIFGSINGATATWRAGRGNDWDQVSLFIALMRAAGYTAEYVMGTVEYEVTRLANWLGVDEEADLVEMVLAYGGVPVAADPSGTYALVTRVWAAAEIDGQTYWFDPAMKEYEYTEAIDLASVIGYDHDAFMARALEGAEQGWTPSHFIRNMNEANIQEDLAAYTMNLVNYIRSNMPDASVADVIGGRRIVPQTLSAYSAELPHALAFADVQSFQEVPDAFRHILRIWHGGIVHTFATFQIAGKRLTMSYRDEDGAPELRLEGELIATGAPLEEGRVLGMAINIDHPYAYENGTYGDQHGRFHLTCGSLYAIVHDFNAISAQLMTHRRDLLSSYRASGLEETSEPVLGEGLSLTGLTYFRLLHLFTGILDQVGQTITIEQHIIGVVGQEDGYFIDLPMVAASFSPMSPGVDVGPVFRVRAFMGSAFEHGVLEQRQGSDKPAVSTVKLLQISNSLGYRIFRVVFNTWDNVRPELRNYPDDVLDEIEDNVKGFHEVILPEDGSIPLNQWQGFGYIDYSQLLGGPQLGFLISGGYKGGFSSILGFFDSLYMLYEVWAGLRPSSDLAGIIVSASGDPVDMVTGAYTSETTDLSIGSGEPFGLRFQRFYNSGDQGTVGVLGHGWSHNYQMEAVRHSHGDPGLGQRSPVDAASAIVYAFVALDLMRSSTPLLRSWMATALATKWLMDQLIDNAVSVGLGSKAAQFVRLADGSYNPPPGMALQLVEGEAGCLLLDQVEGKLYAFDAEGRIVRWEDRNGNGLTFTYDEEGRLQAVANDLGYSLAFGYTNGLLTSVTDMAGRSVGYEYSDGNLTAYRDAEGRITRYEYDADNRLTAIYGPESPTQPMVTNVYDEWGRVITQTDALGNVSTFLYSGYRNVEVNPAGGHQVHYFDAQGRSIGREDASGHRVQFVYDGQNHLRTLTNRLGDTTSYTYDPASNQVATITDSKENTLAFTYMPQDQDFSHPLGGGKVNMTAYNLAELRHQDGARETMTFDSKGNMTARTDQAGKTWRYEVNDRGQLTRIINPVGGVEDYSHNPDGTLASSTDSDTGVTTYEYDAYKRLIRTIHPDGSFVETTYDLADRVISITDERGGTTTYEYDAKGNLVRSVDPLGVEATYAYDLMGRMTAQTDSRGKTTHYVYNEMGWLVSVTDPNGNTKRFGYDTRGWLTETTDPAGKVWQTVYNDEGLPISTITPLGHVTTMGLDPLGQVVSITDPLGHTTTFTRDKMNRVTATTDPLGRTTAYTYDERGLVSTITLPDGGVITYEHDDLGSLVTIHDQRGEEWNFDHTPMGRLLSQTDPLGHRWQYRYNQRGWLDRVTYPTGDIQSLTYDAAGNPIREHYSNGPDLRFTYDALGRLTAANGFSLAYNEGGQVTASTDAATGHTFGATYDDGGRLESVSYADGLFTVTYQYDSRDLLTQVTDTLTGVSVQFTYDDDGRLIGIQRSNGVNTTFTWDAASRLIRIQDGDLADLRYTYNAAGDVIQAVLDLPLDPADYLMDETESFTYDAASQVSSAGYAYDAQGRLIASPGHTYTWDGASRLVGIDDVALAYNGQDDLLTRTESGQTIHYHYNYALAMHPIVAEQDEGTGQFQRYYVWTPDGRLLYMIDATGGNSVYFYHFDQVGSTLALTDAGGSLTDAYAYTPYGRLLHHRGTNSQPFTYVGQWGVRQEGDSGTLYHMGARYYDAITARFLSRDPLWPDFAHPVELNPYQYAAANPLRYIDPEGTSAKGNYFEEYLKPWLEWLEWLADFKNLKFLRWIKGWSKLARAVKVPSVVIEVGTKVSEKGLASVIGKTGSKALRFLGVAMTIAEGALAVYDISYFAGTWYYGTPKDLEDLVDKWEEEDWTGITSLVSWMGDKLGEMLRSAKDAWYRLPREVREEKFNGNFKNYVNEKYGFDPGSFEAGWVY